MGFDGLQAVLRKVEGGVASEAEADQSAELIALPGAHHLAADGFVGDAVGVGAGLCVVVQMGIVLRHGEIEQGDAVVEDRRGTDDLAGAVVPQHAEVAKVPVLVIDDRVEHQHAFQLLGGLFADPGIVFQAPLDAAGLHQMPDGDVGGVYVREQLALGSQDVLPVLQVVVDAMEPHALGDLAGVVLAVRLPAGVGRALRAALVEIDAVPLDEPPRLAQHALGGQLRGGGEDFPALADAGIGHQGQHAGKAVLIQIVFRKTAGKAQGHDPIAVVEGKSFADVDDALGVVDAEPQGLQDLVHKGPVLGDDPALQPMDDPIAGQREVQGEHGLTRLVYGEDLRFQSLQPTVLQPEGQKLLIV